jgi:glycogen operon protein
MTAGDWANPSALALTMYLDGSDALDRAADGSPMTDDDFLVLVNASWEPLGFTIPPARPRVRWQLAIDSYDPARRAAVPPLAARGTLTVSPRSIVVLRGPLPG